MTQNLVILGSTGSIGQQALDVVDKRGYNVVALTANSNYQVLENQIRKYKPKYVSLVDENSAKELKSRIKDTNTKVLYGMEGVCECASINETDTVLNSIVGMAGLKPTLSAIKSKKTIALANKETLVAGGKLVTDYAKKHKVSIIPVDSEHSAIFQSLQGCPKKKTVKKIILTASGGPFFSKTKDELQSVTIEDALNHPNWSMGAKITVDSATMMNKGLELIEAVWLFDMKPEDIHILIHRESILHSAIEYVDNSVICQMGLPDMRIPIQYALTYPERFSSPVSELDFAKIGKLTFYEPDYETFVCMNLCKEAIKKGGLYPAIVNSANEEANYLFRKGKIKFLEIGELVSKALNNIPSKLDYTLDDVISVSKQTKEYIDLQL